MAHDVEKWRQLLSEWQDGYAQHGQALFALYAVTWDERGNAFAPGESWAQLGHNVGNVPLCEEPDLCMRVVSLRPGEGYSPLAEIEQGWIDSGIPVAERSEEAREAFEALAARCGASLPVSIRNSISVEPHGAVSWWLTCMYFASPPERDEVTSEERSYRLFWGQPFFDAIATIERLKLTEDNPRFSWLTDKAAGLDPPPESKESATRGTKGGSKKPRGRGRPTVNTERDAAILKMNVNTYQATEVVEKLASQWPELTDAIVRTVRSRNGQMQTK